MRPSVRMLNSKKAVTMVEAVIAVILISVVAIAGFAYATYVKSLSLKSENYIIASELACQTLERLTDLPYTDANLNVTPPGTNVPDPIAFPSYLATQYNAQRYYTVNEALWDSGIASSQYKEISATITWDDGSERSLSMSVRRTKI